MDFVFLYAEPLCISCYSGSPLVSSVILVEVAMLWSQNVMYFFLEMSFYLSQMK